MSTGAFRTHELAESCGHLEGLLRAHLSGIMEFEAFYTRLVIESRLLPHGSRGSWVAIQSAISFHFSQVLQRELKPAEHNGVQAYMLFNMWMGLVHYYLANGDLFAPEGNVIQRYGEVLIQNFMKLLPMGREEDENG